MCDFQTRVFYGTQTQSYSAQTNKLYILRVVTSPATVVILCTLYAIFNPQRHEWYRQLSGVKFLNNVIAFIFMSMKYFICFK